MTTFLSLFAIYLIIGWSLIGPDVKEYVRLSKSRKHRDLAVRFAVLVGVIFWPFVIFVTRGCK